MDDPTTPIKKSNKPHGVGGPVENNYAEKHGGAAALKAIEDEKPFTSLAAARECEVREAFEAHGAGAVIVRNAIRLQTVSELYYDAITAAAQAHDQAKLEAALKVWGWVTNSAVRAWDLVRREIKQDDRVALTRQVLDAIKQVGQDDPNE